MIAFAELCDMEVEHLIISKDTSESDLKQRKEIVDGSVVYIDQAPVRAAVHGRLLILDGIEKAERNAGCVVLFPSYLMHRVTPVTRGTRKSFVLWLGGGHYK